jgi:outer membrane protein TolC
MTRPPRLPRARRATAVAAALALAGCASFSADGGFGAVERMTLERTGQSPRLVRTPEDHQAVRARVAELIAAPLGAASAVELALLNNPGLQASFRELGIAEADLVQAGRMRNPVFHFANLRSPEAFEIERALLFDLLGLLTMPQRVAMQRTRFEQAQLEAASQAVAVAAEARRAWTAAVASRELVAYAGQVQDAADASAELARRMTLAGNFSRLAQMREQTFYAEATAQLARARHQATADRERLVRVLGLWGADTAFTLPERLPELPKTPAEPRDAEQRALEQRLDVQAARRASAALAESLGLTRVTRLVDGFELGYANASERGEPRKDGYELSFQLPLFDWGTARVARAESLYRQSLERAAQTAIDARSQVRERYSAYRTAYDLARHYRDEVVPLARRISEENLLRYNGMLIGTFELLADARDQVRSVVGAVEALRDFWVADADLQQVLTAGPPGAAPAPRTAAAPAASAASAGH